MSHLIPIGAAKASGYSQKNDADEAERTVAAFSSSAAAITAINFLGFLSILATKCESGKYCPEADISCADIAIASLWVAAGGMIGQMATLPPVRRDQFESKEQLKTFKKTVIQTASSCSALAFQCLFRFAAGLVESSKQQESLTKRCETELLVHLFFITGMICYLGTTLPTNRR